VHEAADSSDWRKPENRYTTTAFLHRQMLSGKPVSPILAVFGVTVDIFKFDWLHCVDKGIAADFLGHEMELLVSKMDGPNVQARCNQLSDLMVQYYNENRKEDRLKSFKRETYAGSATIPPKLHGSASQIRGLVKFGDQMAQRFLNARDPYEAAIQQAAHCLHNCYQSLAGSSGPCAHFALNLNAKQFALNYHALYVHVGDGVAWRVMPKMHQFLELASEGTEPQKFWCYRDEDFGGSVAKQSKMRGMWKNLTAYSKHALDMFQMKNPVPRIAMVTE